MRQAKLGRSMGDAANNLPRCHAEVIHRLVEGMDVAGLMALPHFHTARIHQLGSKTLGGAEQPGDERLQLLRLVLLNRAHNIVVVAHQDVKPLVDARRVLEFLVRVAAPRGGMAASNAVV